MTLLRALVVRFVQGSAEARHGLRGRSKRNRVFPLDLGQHGHAVVPLTPEGLRTFVHFIDQAGQAEDVALFRRRFAQKLLGSLVRQECVGTLDRVPQRRRDQAHASQRDLHLIVACAV